MRLLFFALFAFSFAASAQENYITQTGIRYYTATDSITNPYIYSQCKLDLYYPANRKDYATIIWFHGGGITGGNREIPKALMEKGYALIGVGYRLSPKVQSPAYILDAAAAVAWVFKNIGKYGGNDKLIFVSGHSAGAYLATMITFDKKYLAQHNIDADRIAGLIPLSGQAITHFTVRQEKGIKGTQPIIDNLAPLYHVRPDAPPTLLITGDREEELLGRYEENAYLARMLKLSGHTRTKLYELQGFNHNNMPDGAYPLLLKEVAEITKDLSK